MKDQDFAEIVAITLWKKNVQFRIHGIYSPPKNKNLNLDTLLLSRNAIIMGDFNATSPNWGSVYYNRVGDIVDCMQIQSSYITRKIPRLLSTMVEAQQT
ncbi:hypothetical protein NPIL_162171 [Nephila pilipes]|uniref:Endonuclease/exonuclease/phosphatase domain-containing protein n=1 Tax=Nephila pilipes TaxID=299642 RepID=A0A8X6PX69_NEPPI|nr:hypothetical protein NPIL_162171 [Nephila pilipes]